MLPMSVKSSAGAVPRASTGRVHGNESVSSRARWYALWLLLVVAALYALQFAYSKCDTRSHMSTLLTKTTAILQRHEVEYWLDKGTLLGVHRDDGLIPWEYDVDLGVMNATCAQISTLKSEFTKVGLTAYDRADYIPHKVKLTYDTENRQFYWSDPFMHDPCIRVYDTNDISTWVDIYWYVELDARQVAAQRDSVLIPPRYDWDTSLLCCSEGLKQFTEHMCCGGCVPKDTVFPLRRREVTVSDGVAPTQLQYVPQQVARFLGIQYGEKALTTREIKGWKGIVCGFWISPFLFIIEILAFSAALALAVRWCCRRRRASEAKPRSL